MSLQPLERILGGGRLGHGTRFALVAKQQIGLHQSLVERPIEQVDDERFRTGQGDLRAVLLGDRQSGLESLPGRVGLANR